jgi:hypothetical protein
MPTGGQTDGRMDEQIEVTKLIVAFRNFSNALLKYCIVTASFVVQ